MSNKVKGFKKGQTKKELMPSRVELLFLGRLRK